MSLDAVGASARYCPRPLSLKPCTTMRLFASKCVPSMPSDLLVLTHVIGTARSDFFSRVYLDSASERISTVSRSCHSFHSF